MNVVILRYDPEGRLFSLKKLSGRSRCPHCGQILSAWDLVPVLSFLFLRGRCGACRGKISLQYPFVELASGIVFGGLPLFLNWFFGVGNGVFFSFLAPWWYYALVLSWVLVFLVWIVLVVVDFRMYIIPDELNVILLALGVCITLLVSGYAGGLAPFRESFVRHYALVFSPFGNNALMNHILGFFIAGFVFWILYGVSRGKGMGMGDVKVAFAMGLVLGWPDAGLAILLSFVSGGLVSFILFALRRKGMKDRVPFAPFIVLGSALTVLGGFDLVQAYFGLFSL